MIEGINWFWRLAAVDEAPLILSLILVAIAFTLWLQFTRRVGRLTAALDQMIAIVKASEGPSAFRQRYSQTFADLSANPMLGELWRAFASTLTHSQGGDTAIGYARRPRETFNDQVLTSVGINMRFYGAVPNLLVGLGLLFSFIGLVAALYFAARGVASESVDAAQAALGELLAVATFKFTTSIAGLASSLVFSWGEKRQVYKVQHRLQKLCAALEARMIPVTSESLMQNQLERTRSIEQHLVRLSRAVYVRVPEALEDTMASELRAAMQPLHRAIARAASEFTMAKAETLIDERRPNHAAPPEQLEVVPHGSTAPPRLTELSAVADRRFERLIDGLSASLERLRGKQPAHERVAELETVLGEGLIRLRDTRQTVRAMHEQLDQGLIGSEDAMAILEEVDRTLVATREALRNADGVSG